MRALLCIGCDSYDYVNPVAGAELDARRMYDVLLQPDRGGYDTIRSRLVLSPTLEQVRRAIQEVLFVDGQKVDTFTFFFAGHGAVHGSSFYMALRETRLDALSMTAFSLAELLRILNDASPAQTNIVIDACESGGVIKDLGTLLKAEGLGNADSSGLSLVATSAMDQESVGTVNGGFGTNAILDCIEGRTFVNDRSPFLDLVEIGRRVSEIHEWPDQDPVVHGINLIDTPRFCRNPKFNADPSTPFRDVIRDWPAPSGEISKDLYEALWRSYSSLNRSFRSDRFVEEMSVSFAKLADEPENLARVAARLVEPMSQRARESRDVFQPARTCAGLAVALLPFSNEEPIQEVAIDLSRLLIQELIAAGKQLVADLKADKYALLGGSGGPADLFFLPIRISSVLGWMGAVRLAVNPSDEICAEVDLIIDELLEAIEGTYANSILAICDSQAASWCCLFGALLLMERQETAERLAGRVFHSIVQYGGKLARFDISSEKVLTFLLAREQKSYEKIVDLIERPIETLTVLLLLADRLNLKDVWDPSLWRLDGLALSAFLPKSYKEYSQSRIDDGRNLVWTVGFDVFTAQDFLKAWPNDSPVPENEITKLLSVFAALLFSDRVPWFTISAK